MASVGQVLTGTWDQQTATRLQAIRLGRVGYTGYRGTAAAPVLSLEEDQSTGIYSAAASTINISCGGTNVFGMTTVASDTSIPPTTAPRVYVVNITPTATTSASVVEQTFTVTGLTTTDTILAVNPPLAGQATWFIAGYRVSAANTLKIAFGSITGTPTPTQGNYRVVAIQSAS